MAGDPSVASEGVGHARSPDAVSRSLSKGCSPDGRRSSRGRRVRQITGTEAVFPCCAVTIGTSRSVAHLDRNPNASHGGIGAPRCVWSSHTSGRSHGPAVERADRSQPMRSAASHRSTPPANGHQLMCRNLCPHLALPWSRPRPSTLEVEVSPRRLERSQLGTARCAPHSRRPTRAKLVGVHRDHGTR